MTKLSLFLLGLVATCTARADHAVQDAVGAAAGIFGGIYIHEVGHALAFRAAGAQDIRIRVPGPQCALLCGQTEVKWSGTRDPGTAKIISTAGFLASNLSTELLLHHEGSAKSAVGQGVIATNLYSNLAHVVTYYTRVRGRDGYSGNDIDDFEVAGGNPHMLSAGLLAYSAYALHRMHKKKIPVLFVQARF